MKFCCVGATTIHDKHDRKFIAFTQDELGDEMDLQRRACMIRAEIQQGIMNMVIDSAVSFSFGLTECNLPDDQTKAVYTLLSWIQNVGNNEWVPIA